jgi:hypothetical protein
MTAFAVAGLSIGGALAAVVVVAGFVAHEPAAVLLGLRGPRSRRHLARPAMTLLIVCLLAAAAAASGSIWAMDHDARWSIAIPVVPALLLVVTMLRNREKSCERANRDAGMHARDVTGRSPHERAREERLEGFSHAATADARSGRSHSLTSAWRCAKRV